MKIKITSEGQACRKCGTPVVKKSHDRPTRWTQEYWFRYWFFCPKCKTRYMVEEAKVWQADAAEELGGVEIPADRLAILDS